MEVNLELKCSGTKEIERLTLTVCDWDEKCVGDLKKIFQNKIDVPACDQKLSYQCRSLNDELLPLKKLYFREGDLIEVEFLSKGNIAEMALLLEHLKKFSEKIVEVNQNQLLTVNKKELKDRRSWFIDRDQVLYALEELSFTYFIPWKDPKSVIHRHFFVQEGGFKAFMAVLKFSSKRYRAEENFKSYSKFNFRKLKAKEAEGKEQWLRELNNEQMILQRQCLSLLWNFSETAHDRRLVLQEEGLQPVIMALLLDPFNYDDDADEYWEVASINETAVGCLVQYAEFADCQEIIASNSEVINKLLLMVENQLCSSQSELPETFSVYSTQIAANTLFCCACGLQTPAILVRLSLHRRMMDLTSRLLEGQENLALRYYCTLFLARIQASPLVNLDPITKAAINKIIESFLDEFTPCDITAWEENHHYVWVSLVPFVSLAFTGRSHSEEANVTKKQDGGCIKELETMFDEEDGPSCPHLKRRDNHSYEGSATGQHHSSDSRDKKEPVESHLHGGAVGCVTCTTSTSSELQEGLRSELGSEQTHKLGLFTLHHMLQSGENRHLLETERLFPYLECLCWHLSAENSMLLKQELSKHWPLTPPSLTVTCKSVLAFTSGFEVVHKM